MKNNPGRQPVSIPLARFPGTKNAKPRNSGSTAVEGTCYSLSRWFPSVVFNQPSKAKAAASARNDKKPIIFGYSFILHSCFAIVEHLLYMRQVNKRKPSVSAAADTGYCNCFLPNGRHRSLYENLHRFALFDEPPKLSCGRAPARPDIGKLGS